MNRCVLWYGTCGVGSYGMRGEAFVNSSSCLVVTWIKYLEYHYWLKFLLRSSSLVGLVLSFSSWEMISTVMFLLFNHLGHR